MEEIVVVEDDEASSRDGLLFTLVQRLQVCRPVLVLRKPLVRTHLSRHQNNLSITHGEYRRGLGRPGLLTGEEHAGVHGALGLPLQALDRRGRRYGMVLVHLKKIYRLRTGWGSFLRNAGVVQDEGRHVGDVVEMWAFRSPAWGKKGNELGLVMLHYSKEEDAQMTMAAASSAAGGGCHRQVVRQFDALSAVAGEEDDEDEDAIAVSAAVTLVSTKRSRSQAGSVLVGETKIGDLISGAGKFSKDGEGKSGSSNQHTAQLTSQVNNLREEIQNLASKPATLVTSAAKSGPGRFTITAIVVAGVIGYAYIKWKGLKLSDMMFVTKRGLADACNVVGSQLDQVSDTVVVTRKHLAGRIDRVDINLDETQQIIEGTRDEVAVIHGDLSAFQQDLQSVNLVVRTLESKMGRLESTQDQTVDGIHHLCEFTRKMEPAQLPSSIPASIGSSSERIVRSTSLPPAPRLALEEISPVAESHTTESPQVSRAAESSRAEALQEQKGAVTQTSTGKEGSSHVMSSSTVAGTDTPNSTISSRFGTSSSRFGGLRLPGLGLGFLGASSAT